MLVLWVLVLVLWVWPASEAMDIAFEVCMGWRCGGAWGGFGMCEDCAAF